MSANVSELVPEKNVFSRNFMLEELLTYASLLGAVDVLPVAYLIEHCTFRFVTPCVVGKSLLPFLKPKRVFGRKR